MIVAGGLDPGVFLGEPIIYVSKEEANNQRNIPSGRETRKCR